MAGYFLNIGTAIGLVRRLQEDQELSNLCGFSRVPSRITVGRFLGRLAENGGEPQTQFFGTWHKMTLTGLD